MHQLYMYQGPAINAAMSIDPIVDFSKSNTYDIRIYALCIRHQLGAFTSPTIIHAYTIKDGKDLETPAT